MIYYDITEVENDRFQRECVREQASQQFPCKSVHLSLSNIVIHHQNNCHDITNITKIPTFTLYIFLSVFIRSVQMLSREWDAKSNGKLPHLFIPSKTAAWVNEFAVKDLPLSRTAALAPESAVKDLHLGRILCCRENDDDDPIYN